MSSAGTHPFPLPLSDRERYLLADDREQHPLVGEPAFRFPGTLNRDPFPAALTDAERPPPAAGPRPGRLRRPGLAADGRGG